MRYVETLTGQATRALLTDRLWPNQREALATVEGYLASKTQRQCLVRMPTGSGKTAVIAVLAQLLANHEKVLVIAPWEHLTSQLREQLAASFWQKSRMRDEFSFRSVRQCTPANASDQLTAVADGGVLVCTNSTLQELHIGFRETYAKLKAWTSLVLVDEGHREPAPKWALAVRQLRKPTVLFSATPYRNDSRLFP